MYWIIISMIIIIKFEQRDLLPLVPETKMADVCKLVSLGNLLARKVLTTTSATLILSRAFGADCVTWIAYIYSKHLCSYIVTSRETHTHTYTLSLFLSLSLSLSCILTSSSQPHENVYILQPFSFLFCLFG